MCKKTKAYYNLPYAMKKLRTAPENAPLHQIAKYISTTLSQPRPYSVLESTLMQEFPVKMFHVAYWASEECNPAAYNGPILFTS